MRIMLDTNILISTIVFKGEKLSRTLDYICHNHRLVLSTFVLDELEYIILKKFNNKLVDYYKFITTISYEIEYTPKTQVCLNEIKIRDENDIPVLYSAITSNVDILITGDKDFEEIDIEKPVIMNANQFYEEYIKI